MVPDSGHWIMEENSKATIAPVRAFLDKGQRPRTRLTAGLRARLSIRLDAAFDPLP
jgi:hypothetical protein